jgi:hypothetical protein
MDHYLGPTRGSWRRADMYNNGRKILHVDDDPLMTSIVKERLEPYDYELTPILDRVEWSILPLESLQ